MDNIANQLISAACEGNVRNLEALIKKGFSPNLCDEQQRSALSWASAQGHIATVRLLLQYGANPEIVSNDGWTALKLAEHKGHNGIAHILRSCQQVIGSQKIIEVSHLLKNKAALLTMTFGADNEDVHIRCSAK